MLRLFHGLYSDVFFLSFVSYLPLTNIHRKFLQRQVTAFPYSILSVRPGADPGVQAVSPHVTISHPPSGRLPLLSARPAVTSPAAEHHRPLAGTKLYCLVTEAHRCKHYNLPKVVMQHCLEQDLNSRPIDRKSNLLPVVPSRHKFLECRIKELEMEEVEMVHNCVVGTVRHGHCHVVELNAVRYSRHVCVCVKSDEVVSDGRHVVMINVSPLEYGHVLLVPHIDLRTPQVHTHTHTGAPQVHSQAHL